jgi:hypothetical protein
MLHSAFSSVKGRVATLRVAEEVATDRGHDLTLKGATGSFKVSVDKQGKFLSLDFFDARPGVPEENRAVKSPLHSLIPFQLIGRLIAVEGKVNSVEGLLIVDSGAPCCILNSDIFGGLEGRAIASDDVSGAIAGAKRIKVDSLQFGDVEIREFSGRSQPLTHLARDEDVKLLGLIGYRELSEFEVLLDYRQKTMWLLKTDADGNRLAKVTIPPPGETIPFEMAEHLPILTCELGGETLRMGLDTGAEANLLDIGLREKFSGLLVSADNTTLGGAGGTPVEVDYGMLPELKVGNVTLRNTTTVFSDISHLNKGPGILELDGIIGCELLARARLAGINFRKKELYLW